MKLNERQIRAIIRESARRVLREYDEPFPYGYKDAREREAYFERACKHDFGAEGQYKTERSWESTYYALLDKKKTAEYERAKADKEAQRAQRKQDALKKKQDMLAKRNSQRMMWYKAVDMALFGDDDYESENYADGYDGVSSFPLYFADGTYAMFQADGINQLDSEFADQFNEAWSCSSLSGYVDGMGEEPVEFNIAVNSGDRPGGDLDVVVQCSVERMKRLNRVQTQESIAKLLKREAIRCYKQLGANGGKLGTMKPARAWNFDKQR